MSPTFTAIRDGKPALMKRCRTCKEAKIVSEDASVSGFYLSAKASDGRAAAWRADCKHCLRTDPGLRAKRAAQGRAWRKRKKRAQPAYFAEYARMAYRLRQEKKGLPVNVRASRAVVLRPRDSQPRLPAGPLVRFVADRVAAGETEMAVCGALGLCPRRMHSWRTGAAPMVAFDGAELALMNAGLTWEDLWPAVEFPRIAARIGYAGTVTP